MMAMTIIGALFALCLMVVEPAVEAVPTQEELYKADPFLQEVVKAENETLRCGKKTCKPAVDLNWSLV